MIAMVVAVITVMVVAAITAMACKGLSPQSPPATLSFRRQNLFRRRKAFDRGVGDGHVSYHNGVDLTTALRQLRVFPVAATEHEDWHRNQEEVFPSQQGGLHRMIARMEEKSLGT